MTVVAILGGSGRLGQRVMAGLLSRGCTIRALAHRSAIANIDPRIIVVRGDVHDAAAIVSLLAGADMVVTTLGSAGAPVVDVCSTAIAHLVPAMRAHGIERIVSTTGSAARLDREDGREHRWLATRRKMLMRHMAPMILDAEEHMRLLEGSGLKWTVLRAPIMGADTSSAAMLAPLPGPPDSVLGYDAVATLLVDELFATQWINAAPFAVAR